MRVERYGNTYAREFPGHVGQTIALVTFDGVLAVEALLRADLLVEELCKSGRKSDQRSTGIEDSASVVELSGVLAKGDGIEVDLPVSLASEREFDHLAGVSTGINTTEGDHRLGLLVGIAKIKCEDGLVEKSLVDHVVEWRRNVVDGNGVVSHTKNAIKSAEGESKTRLARGLTKQLVLDLKVSNLEDIFGDETSHFARAISDTELRAVLLVGG